ncbi:MAG: hypothetical protein IID44_21640 [Planctomycetes bacterium]|nr:hypothetical protein [Planctomycetota bacterium]
MQRHRTWILLVGLLLMVGSPATAREWTSRTGKFSVEADLVDVKDGKVRLEQKGGKIITVPVSELSKADRKYLASIAKIKKNREKTKKNSEEAKAISDVLDASVGKLVNVELTIDRYYRDVKLLEVVRNKKTGEWKAMKLEIGPSPFDMLAKKKVITVGARQTYRILGDDGKPFFESSKAKKESEKRRAWRERLANRRIRAWPHMTRAEHEKVLEDRLAYLKKVSETFTSLRLYQSNFFLFASNIPAAHIVPYVKALDAMHVKMCEMYRIKKGTPVWRGKCVVIAFSRREEFVAFEQKFMRHAPGPTVNGLCHSRSNGDVTISCFAGKSKSNFAHMLVHETSHGFNHRFQTSRHIPSWINEGIAEVVGELMVPASRSVKLKESSAMRTLNAMPRVGGNFFGARNNIQGWQYGIASHITKFLIKTNPKSFVAFIQGVKEGMTPEESLAQYYGATYDQLLIAYGRSIGLPNLQQ